MLDGARWRNTVLGQLLGQRDLRGGPRQHCFGIDAGRRQQLLVALPGLHLCQDVAGLLLAEDAAQQVVAVVFGVAHVAEGVAVFYAVPALPCSSTAVQLRVMLRRRLRRRLKRW